MKAPQIFIALLVTAGIVVGCNSSNTYKEHTPTAKTAPVKVPKNDPDHIHYIYPDGSTVSQVWTNSTK